MPERRLEDQFLVDHLLQRLLFESIVVQLAEIEIGPEHFLQPETLSLIRILKFTQGDFPVVDLGHHHVHIRSKVLMNAPQGERGDNQANDDPHQDPLRPISDALQHDDCLSAIPFDGKDAATTDACAK